MCGIVAVVRRPSRRTPPTAGELTAELDACLAALGAGIDRLDEAADRAERLDGLLHGVAGVRALLGDAELTDTIRTGAAEVQGRIAAIEANLDAGEGAALEPSHLEAVNAALVRLKDAVWAIERDRLRMAAAVADLAGPNPSMAAVEAFTSIQIALSAIDRLEVRGRDSAGIHILVSGGDLVAAAPDRLGNALFTSMAMRAPEGHLSFVYKAAAEIGELGDNTAQLRAAITTDDVLHSALAGDGVEALVLAHTRWASVGIISQANAHPLNSEETGRTDGPYVTAALNGDVDNYADLRQQAGLRIPVEITTDAKVIPTLVSRRLADGMDIDDAFRATVASFEGSVAIGASAVTDPKRLHLALKGSGQGLYVGLAEDAFVVVSEPYGLVEETSTYLRMDGETTRGQVVVLDADDAGTVDGIRRVTYDGDEMPVSDADLQRAEITTRDIDRAGFPHYLLKEIIESPKSFRKTLRGKIAQSGQHLQPLVPTALTDEVSDRLRRGDIKRILVIGQGTAAIAGQSLAAVLVSCIGPSGITTTALPATELSGFGLDDDMSDALVIAISQSGTTTDTNRTVDLVRARGALVVSIVNRRNSDLVERSDGVLYTSDGRDVEMAVPSTKAFYAQVAAGFVLALAIAELVGCGDKRRTSELLSALRNLPDAMEQVLSQRAEIGQAAQAYAPSRRYWAIVGNGSNRVAANEIRIKLSELCYKSISCDATEDKKHIDLAAEPLILVCAAGLSGPNASDVAKEVAIYRAHKAAPIVIASQGVDVFTAALHVITVPDVHPELAFILSAMAGHLFGYEAALSIDALARPLREVRSAIESAVSEHALANGLRTSISQASRSFFDGLRAGVYNGQMEANTAVELVSLLRYATGALPIEAYEVEYGKVGTPSAVVTDLTEALTKGIDELTRPIDAIKHQAKTVTVGISRSEDDLLTQPLVAELLATGTPRDRLSYRALRALAALGPAVEEVTGYTRYVIEGGLDGTIHVVDKGGDTVDLPSRTEHDPRLTGTKHRAAEEREVTVTRGGRDGRTLILVPEVKDNQPTGMTLLHVRFADRLDAQTAREVLSGYRGRYNAVVDAVTETEPNFDDGRLAEVPLVDLLTVPVHVLADQWRTR
jgi:glutamine---fructose-6-phosphate transaminase (isomerizing)